MESLETLEELLAQGFITQDEYTTRKAGFEGLSSSSGLTESGKVRVGGENVMEFDLKVQVGNFQTRSYQISLEHTVNQDMVSDYHRMANIAENTVYAISFAIAYNANADPSEFESVIMKFLNFEFKTDIDNGEVKFATHQSGGYLKTCYLNVMYEKSALPKILENKLEIKKLEACLELDTTHSELAASLRVSTAFSIKEDLPPPLALLLEQLQSASLSLKFKSLKEALNHPGAKAMVTSMDIEEIILVVMLNIAQFDQNPFQAYHQSLCELVRGNDSEDVLAGVALMSAVAKAVDSVPTVTITCGKHIFTLKCDIPQIFAKFPAFPTDVLDIAAAALNTPALPVSVPPDKEASYMN